MQPEFVGQKFELDVTSGHIATETVSGTAHEGVWARRRIAFIDGAVMKTGQIPVLVYDESTEKYWEQWPHKRIFSDVDNLARGSPRLNRKRNHKRINRWRVQCILLEFITCTIWQRQTTTSAIVPTPIPNQ